MVSAGIHRLIEHQAATRPDALALADETRTLTFRELNQRANTLARQLIASGLTRGAHAIARMPRSIDLAVVLLAVLKAGGRYTWIDPAGGTATDIPEQFCISRSTHGGERRYLALDLTAALEDAAARPTANLPILAHGSDIACVLPAADGSPLVLVPHSTITALTVSHPPRLTRWGADPCAFDLWVALMSGLSVTLTSAQTAAA